MLRRVRTPGGRSGAGPSGMVASQLARRHKALAKSFSSMPRATAGREREGPGGQVPGPADPRRGPPAPDPDPSSMVMGGCQPPHPPLSLTLAAPPSPSGSPPPCAAADPPLPPAAAHQGWRGPGCWVLLGLLKAAEDCWGLMEAGRGYRATPQPLVSFLPLPLLLLLGEWPLQNNCTSHFLLHTYMHAYVHTRTHTHLHTCNQRTSST